MSFAFSEGNPVEDTSRLGKPPFDTDRLDRLMEEAELDALLVTSKHSIQYLLGGYRFFFYDFMDAHGLSRYLPFFVYVKGRPLDSGYVGVPMERYEKQLGSFWVSNLNLKNFQSKGFAGAAAEMLKGLNGGKGKVGIEVGFMPIDAYQVLEADLPDAKLTDATFTLEILRALKSPAELDLLREASEKVVDSMLAVFATHGPGVSKRALFEALRMEETKRGMKFEYALTNIGTAFNRAPYDKIWEEGETLALDSGGNYKGYIGDLCRMCFTREPDQELVDLLGQVEEVQQAARKGLRPGVIGGEIFEWANEAKARCAEKDRMFFSAHGMGIVSHEAPWLMPNAVPVYPAYHADRPLESGMVISIETELHHTKRGFIKLEDTVAIIGNGWEAYGDGGRGWNVCGAA
ncbi:M24 family metallopeptidase [Amaricoccus solimangrovi]|uniref:Aminopeptidase P family protein n=1 Tax=Amaricoccus solimangrovi TaxID=2589815 RepID=A0A501WUY0_9RHOB|nr:Xaa-Pro peptidase family protein [Amaricoccus solimangrovi]TPE49676.1 aminopeptidase P family protein [Amaricoccus solimangrovi]